MLHHAADDRPCAVTEAIHVDLDRRFEKLVDEDWFARRDIEGAFHVATERLLIVDDLHGPTAQDVAGPYQHRIADPPSDVYRLLQIERGSIRRLFQAQAL